MGQRNGCGSVHPLRLLARYSLGESVTKRVRQLIAWFLALAFAAAGMVAISPALHVAVEHGGNGPMHSHFGLATPGGVFAHPHQHGDGPWHSHEAPVAPRSPLLFQHSFQPFGLPKISLDGLWQALAHFFDTASSTGSLPSKDGPGHQHQSLFQLLASGLVDQPLDFPVLPSIPFALVTYRCAANTNWIARDWDAQTASRGPPFGWS